MRTDETTLHFDPARALAAMRALTRDPDDTAQVFTIIDSLSGHAPEHVMQAFRADASGRRLLRERPDIVPVLADREALRRMPAGSLAHAYLAFVESEGITADGLVAASEAGRVAPRAEGSDFEYVSQRLRDTHDLWHAVTGYRGDLIGEAALLAFNVPQTRNPALAMIALVGLARIRQVGAATMIAEGFRRGRRASWLPAVDWESLLPMPIEAVRTRLGVGAPPRYEPLRTTELRAQGLLEPRRMSAAA